MFRAGFLYELLQVWSPEHCHLKPQPQLSSHPVFIIYSFSGQDTEVLLISHELGAAGSLPDALRHTCCQSISVCDITVRLEHERPLVSVCALCN